MNKTVLAIIIMIIVLTGGAFAYKAYKQNQMQNNQLTTQSQTIHQSSNTSSGATNTSGNTVDQSSSPQEQQIQQNLNSLDGGDHN